MVERKDITVLFNPEEASKRGLTEIELCAALLKYGYLNAWPRTNCLGFGVTSHKPLTSLMSAIFLGDVLQIVNSVKEL